MSIKYEDFSTLRLIFPQLKLTGETSFAGISRAQVEKETFAYKNAEKFSLRKSPTPLHGLNCSTMINKPNREKNYHLP